MVSLIPALLTLGDNQGKKNNMPAGAGTKTSYIY